MSILEIGMKNGSAMLENLGANVPDTQFVRELQQNEQEAGATEIDIDMDWKLYESQGLMKLAFIGNGSGMKGEELLQYINNLASGSKPLSPAANHGNGAKISTFPKNPEGTIYLSRKDGVNSQMRFERDKETGLWGARTYPVGEGKYANYIEVSDEVMPELIMNSGHGTAVVLLGKDEQANTLLPPKGNKFEGSNWIIKELNSRYYKVPSHCRLRVNHISDFKDGIKSHGWTNIHGNGYFLERYSESSGSIEVDGGTIDYFIVKPDQQNQRQTGIYVTGGHVGLLHQNEIYGSRGSRMLQNFGVNFGSKRVVLYVKPSNELGAHSNAGRSDLVVNGKPFPWSQFADQFRENMPKEIIELEKELAKSSRKTVDQGSIYKNLKTFYSKFPKVSKYRPSESGVGSVKVTEEAMGGRGITINPKKDKNKIGGERKPSTSGGTAGNIYEMHQTKPGEPAEEVKTFDLPKVHWVSISEGTRVAGDIIEDRAAAYSPQGFTIRANSDFRIFRDTENQMRELYKHHIGIEDLISSVTLKWHTQQLQELILVAEQLRHTKMWTGAALEALTSPEAITLAMLPKFNLLPRIQEEVDTAIADSKKQAA